MIDAYNDSRDNSFCENPRNGSSRPEGLSNKTSTCSAGESFEDTPQGMPDAAAARMSDDASRTVPPFEPAGLAPEGCEGSERVRAARDLLSVCNAQNGARDQALGTTPEFYDDARDDVRQAIAPRSDWDVHDGVASEPSAGQHGDVLGALWECYHAVAQSVADGRPELDPRVMQRVMKEIYNAARLAETSACHANAEPDTERRESLDSQDGVQSVGDSYEPTPSAAHTVTTYGAWGSEAGRTRGADGAGAEQRGEHPSPTEHATGRGPTKPREPRACGIYDSNCVTA